MLREGCSGLLLRMCEVVVCHWTGTDCRRTVAVPLAVTCSCHV